MSRLKEKYQKEVVAALTKEFGYKNVMAVPRITKVVVNMGLGEATQNAKVVDTGAEELSKVTGQRAAVTRSSKSIAQFKVRKGMPMNCSSFRASSSVLAVVTTLTFMPRPLSTLR